MSRVDKADILEYAVLHLQELKQQLHTTSGSPRDTKSHSYDTGFKDCAKEAVTFLTTNRLTDENTATEVSNHLYTVFMSRRRQDTVSKTSSISGPCLSTPVRLHNNVLDSRLPSQLTPGCSPIQRYNTTTSPQDMTSHRIPKIDASLGDLSFNTVMSVLNSTDSSNSDVSMRSKESSSVNCDSLSFYSDKFSKMLRFSSENAPHDLSLGTVASVLVEMSASNDSECYTDDVNADVVSDVPAGVATESNFIENKKIHQKIVEVPDEVSERVWRPWCLK